LNNSYLKHAYNENLKLAVHLHPALKKLSRPNFARLQQLFAKKTLSKSYNWFIIKYRKEDDRLRYWRDTLVGLSSSLSLGWGAADGYNQVHVRLADRPRRVRASSLPVLSTLSARDAHRTLPRLRTHTLHKGHRRIRISSKPCHSHLLLQE
jgi:hypothetical protein